MMLFTSLKMLIFCDELFIQPVKENVNFYHYVKQISCDTDIKNKFDYKKTQKEVKKLCSGMTISNDEFLNLITETIEKIWSDDEIQYNHKFFATDLLEECLEARCVKPFTLSEFIAIFFFFIPRKFPYGINISYYTINSLLKKNYKFIIISILLNFVFIYLVNHHCFYRSIQLESCLFFSYPIFSILLFSVLVQPRTRHIIYFGIVFLWNQFIMFLFIAIRKIFIKRLPGYIDININYPYYKNNYISAIFKSNKIEHLLTAENNQNINNNINQNNNPNQIQRPTFIYEFSLLRLSLIILFFTLNFAALLIYPFFYHLKDINYILLILLGLDILLITKYSKYLIINHHNIKYSNYIKYGLFEIFCLIVFPVLYFVFYYYFLSFIISIFITFFLLNLFTFLFYYISYKIHIFMGNNINIKNIYNENIDIKTNVNNDMISVNIGGGFLSINIDNNLDLMMLINVNPQQLNNQNNNVNPNDIKPKKKNVVFEAG